MSNDKPISREALERTADAWRRDVQRSGGEISHEAAKARVIPAIERANKRKT